VFRKNKETKQKKIFKIWDGQIKPIIEAKKTSNKKQLASKKPADKTAYKALSVLYIADSNIHSAPKKTNGMTVTFPWQHFPYLCP